MAHFFWTRGSHLPEQWLILGRIIHLLIIILFSILLFGCQPKGEASDVAKLFYDRVQGQDYESAYNMLADSYKTSCSKENFILYWQLSNELFYLKSAKVNILNDYKSLTINNTKYTDVNSYSVILDTKDYDENKNKKLNETIYVVNENNVWRIVPNGHVLPNISEQYVSIGYQYYYGKGGKTKDNIEAISKLRKSLKYDKNNGKAYYNIALIYNDMDRIDEAIFYYTKALSLLSDSDTKSSAANNLALCYSNKKDYGQAKKIFKKALDFNSANELARDNLLKISDNK